MSKAGLEEPQRLRSSYSSLLWASIKILYYSTILFTFIPTSYTLSSRSCESDVDRGFRFGDCKCLLRRIAPAKNRNQYTESRADTAVYHDSKVLLRLFCSTNWRISS